MPQNADLSSLPRPHRVGRFYTGRPSWRTGLRALRRRLGAKDLPRSDEEVLLDEARKLRSQGEGAGEPVRALRLVRPLPLVFLAADGRTTFRYVQALKNASSSMIYMLMQITGEAAYYPWNEEAHFWIRERMPLERGKYKAGAERLVINDKQMRLHLYAPPFFYRQEVHPPPDIRFCLVRDPVERFASACLQLIIDPYRMGHGQEKGDGGDCQAQPDRQADARLWDIEGFIAKMERRQTVDAERNRHLRSQSWFLGAPENYTHIFSVRQLEEVRAFLSELAQKELTLPTINQTTRRKRLLTAHPSTRQLDFTIPPLTAKQRQRIEAIYADDYRLFGRYF